MKKSYLIVFVSILALLLGSCSGGGEETAEETAPTQPSEAPAETNAEAQAQESEEVQEAGEPLPTVSGLLPQTQAEQRRKEIIPGRPDPFSVIPVEPKIVVKNEGTGTSTNVNSQSADLPPPPENQELEEPEVVGADLAERVVVSGVIELGDITHIIITAPNEAYTRYVQPGQYVANGEVLVKRVEMGSGATPIVVLEQSGIEVFKPVGAEAEEKEETTALLPDY